MCEKCFPELTTEELMKMVKTDGSDPSVSPWVEQFLEERERKMIPVCQKMSLFRVEIEGLPKLTNLIQYIGFGTGSEVKVSFDSTKWANLSVIETEDFDARKSFSEWVGKKMVIKSIKNNGDIAYEESFQIQSITYSTSYAIDAIDSTDTIRWDVNLDLK